jgi:hypothetical protein
VTASADMAQGARQRAPRLRGNPVRPGPLRSQAIPAMSPLRTCPYACLENGHHEKTGEVRRQGGRPDLRVGGVKSV